VIVDVPKDATSLAPFGTVAGVQLAVVFQSLLVGVRFQVALPAKELTAIKHKKTRMTGKSLFMLRSQQKAAAKSSLFPSD